MRSAVRTRNRTKVSVLPAGVEIELLLVVLALRVTPAIAAGKAEYPMTVWDIAALFD